MNFCPPRPGSVPAQSGVKCEEKEDRPGYTVMTRSISASSPTSSDIAVDGVSGEMATPAFIFLSWMECIREMGSAAMNEYGKYMGSGAHVHVASMWKQ
jgi:hypothetical protein